MTTVEYTCLWYTSIKEEMKKSFIDVDKKYENSRQKKCLRCLNGKPTIGSCKDYQEPIIRALEKLAENQNEM